MSLFATNKLFSIDIKYVEVKMSNGAECIYIIDNEIEAEKYKEKVKVFHTSWVQPNWKDNNEALRAATQVDPITGSKSTDLHLYRNIVLERFMKAWDILDENNNPVLITREKIGCLDFNIARALADRFINRSIPTEEELGNLQP